MITRAAAGSTVPKSAMLLPLCSAVAKMVSVDDVADRPARGYSQGQRTRIALARAIVHGPGNLLLDEPTAGLDVMATRGLR